MTRLIINVKDIDTTDTLGLCEFFIDLTRKVASNGDIKARLVVKSDNGLFKIVLEGGEDWAVLEFRKHLERSKDAVVAVNNFLAQHGNLSAVVVHDKKVNSDDYTAVVVLFESRIRHMYQVNDVLDPVEKRFKVANVSIEF